MIQSVRPKSFIVTILVFIACLLVGFWIARHKALWNDEYYTQVSSVRNSSYADQLLGRIPEGGNAPLFYVLQKSFLQLICYQTPSSWLQGHWYNDVSSKILLRINSIVFMSLSVSLVFYYFCRKYSLKVGFYSLFIYFSSYMLWMYWSEARPYALVVFLTTVQSVILLNRMDQGPRIDGDRAWMTLAGINVLLSLASILSLGEILAVSVLWGAKERDWKKYLLMTLLPALITVFYYIHAPKYHFYFDLQPEQLIRDNIARQDFDILFIFLISLSVYFYGQKKKIAQNILGAEVLKPVPYVIFMALVLAFSALVLWVFSLHVTPGKGFPVSSRYFIYLLPIGVIATTLVTLSLVKSLSKQRLMQGILMALIAFLLIQHFLKIVPKTIYSFISG